MKQFNWLTKEDDDADTTVHSWDTQRFNGESDDTVLWFPYTSTTVRFKKKKKLLQNSTKVLWRQDNMRHKHTIVIFLQKFSFV